MYNLAEVFVNPCVYEGCPNTVLQAMACGCPTIVAAAGGSADVAEGAALMAKPMDDLDLSQKLLAVASDATMQKELRSRSLERSRYFTWDKTAAITLGALKRLAGNQ
jgi:glycosyltransferase involved in cell wall biosynthesis